jgi:hypothetical protein
MEQNTRPTKLKTGLWLSWLSLLILPLGVFFGFIGMCAGPNGKDGAILLFGLGICGAATAVYGGFLVLRDLRFGTWGMQVAAVFAVAAGFFAGTVGWIYAAVAAELLRDFLH